MGHTYAAPMNATAATHSSDRCELPPNPPSRSETTLAIGSAPSAAPKPSAVGPAHRFTERKLKSYKRLEEFGQ